MGVIKTNSIADGVDLTFELSRARRFLRRVSRHSATDRVSVVARQDLELGG